MKILTFIAIFIFLVVSYVSYSFSKMEFGHHIHFISQESALGKVSKLWLKSCPEILTSEVEPNSIFGSIVAGRELLHTNFEFVIDTLIECGYDINQRDSLGLTPLHSAVLYSDLIAIIKLLSLGANTEVLLTGKMANKYGEITLIEYAKELKTIDPEIIEYLENYHNNLLDRINKKITVQS